MRHAGRSVVIGLLLLALGGAPARAATSLEGGGLASLERSDGGILGLSGLRFGRLERGSLSSHL